MGTNAQPCNWLDWGAWSCSSLTTTGLLIQQRLNINMYMCIHSYILICVYMCTCGVNHSFACECSCHSVALFRLQEGRKLQIKGIWESQSAISVGTKDLCAQLSYLLSKKVASKDIDSNLFQEGQTPACVVLQKAEKASFCSTRSQSFIWLIKLSKHCFLTSQVTLI